MADRTRKKTAPKKPAKKGSTTAKKRPATAKKATATAARARADKRPPKRPRPPVAEAALRPTASRVKTAQEAFLFFLPQAEALGRTEILPYNLDPVLALQNIQAGLKSLEPSLPVLKKALPLHPWADLLDLPLLAQAVTFAATQVVDRPTQLGELRTQLADAATLRSLLLSTAGALALSGTLPAASVEKIRRGRGPIDVASDLIELAALYRKHPDAMSAQRLVTGAHLDQAAQLGTELLTRLKPAGTRTSTARSGQADVVARDRLATLLWQRHGELRKAAYYLWGDDFERHAPALQSRKNPRKSIPPAPPKPAPSPSGSTPKPEK